MQQAQSLCPLVRPPGIQLQRAFLMFVVVVLIRSNGIHGVWHASRPPSRILQSNVTSPSPEQDPCETVPDTSLCLNGKLDYSYLMIGQYPEMDCLTHEAIEDVSFLGVSAFEEQEQNCANMDGNLQVRAHPPLKYEEVVVGVMCTSQNWAPVYLADWDEVKQLTDTLKLSDCKAVSTIVERNTFQCHESTASVCKGGALDLAVLDTQARPDCPAFEVRADVVTRGPAVLKDWVAYCAAKEGGRLLQYSSNCPGNQVNRITFSTVSSRSSTEISYHWQFHNIRGLLFDPFIVTSGNALGCRDDDNCTTDSSHSCWNSPRMGTGAHRYEGQTRVYTCDGDTATGAGMVHIVGRSSGTYEMQGLAYSVGAANECRVSQPSSDRVRIHCSASAWSDVWIHNLGDGDVIEEFPDLRNVCEIGTSEH